MDTPDRNRFARSRVARYSLAPNLEDATLHIAIVIERFVPGAGGVENVAWQVAHALRHQGEEIVVLTREAHERADVPCRIIPAPTFWLPVRLTLFSRRTARFAANAHPPFDVVHSFSHTRHQDLFRAGGGTQLDTLRRTHHGAAHALRSLSRRHRVRLGIERHVFERSNQRIQCASRLVADALARDHGVDASRIAMIPNAVDAPHFANDRARADGRALRRRVAGEGDHAIWLFPGSGWRRKGLDTALEALARSRDGSARLFVAGRDRTGPWQRKASGLGVADRVHFLGERADMPALYQACDGMILPTRYDPFANVTLEAAAAGRPIATSLANGASEWLEGDADIVREPDDARSFAAILDTWSSAEARRARGERLASRALDFDWPSHARSLRSEYAGIVEERERASKARGDAA